MYLSRSQAVDFMDECLGRKKRLLCELFAIRHIVKKEYRLWQRYPSRILLMLVMPFLSILTLYFQGIGLVGGTSSESFNTLTGTSDYLSFIIIGSSIYVYVSTAIWGIGNSIRREQMMGTLESIWMAPASKLTIFCGIAIFDGLLSTYVAMMQIVLSSIVLPISLLTPKILMMVLLTFLLIFALYGIGFFFTGLVLIFKEIEDFTNLFNTMLRMITPVSYPLSVLPWPLAFIALFIPVTYALQGMREYIGLGTYHSFPYYIGMLLIFDIIFIAIGKIIFDYAETNARRSGQIGAH